MSELVCGNVVAADRQGETARRQGLEVGEQDSADLTVGATRHAIAAAGERMDRLRSNKRVAVAPNG